MVWDMKMYTVWRQVIQSVVIYHFGDADISMFLQ